MAPALTQFRKEIVHFSLVSLVNLIFSALAMASGIAYLVIAVQGHLMYPWNPALRIVSGAVAMVCLGLGISWLVSTSRIFRGVREISAALNASAGPLPGDRVTCLIIRMLAHYRDNRITVRYMIQVSTAGGFFFLVVGIITAIRALTVTGTGGAVTFDSLVLIPGMLLTLGIAIASLLSSYYFSKFEKVWDNRLREIEESECTLQMKLGLEGS